MHIVHIVFAYFAFFFAFFFAYFLLISCILFYEYLLFCAYWHDIEYFVHI